MGHNVRETKLIGPMTEPRFVSPDFSSAEAQRQWYLRQLGVSSYYPRFVLPGAAPSPLRDVPPAQVPATPMQERDPSAPGQQVPARPPDTKGSGKDILAGLRRAPPPDETAAAQTAPAQPGVAVTERQGDAPAHIETPHFRVLLLRAERGLAVCNQVPLQGGEGLGKQEQRLLQNMLAWLGTPWLASPPRNFLWPPRGLEDSTADARDVAARSFFGFLEQAQQEQGFSRLLLMGNSALELLDTWQQSGDHALPWQAFRTPSLGEMLAQPLLKREAWQALQPLHRLLQSR